MGGVKQEWLPGLLTIMAIAAGAVGFFLIWVPAGWLFLMIGLMFMAWVSDRTKESAGV